jgi:hypothetical protein
VFFKGPRTEEERQASQAEEKRIAQATVRAREVGPFLSLISLKRGREGSYYKVVQALRLKPPFLPSVAGHMTGKLKARVFSSSSRAFEVKPLSFTTRAVSLQLYFAGSEPAPSFQLWAFGFDLESAWKYHIYNLYVPFSFLSRSPRYLSTQPTMAVYGRPKCIPVFLARIEFCAYIEKSQN